MGADYVEEAGETIAGLVEACSGLFASGDIGDDALDENAAVGHTARACAIAQNPRHPIESG